MPLPPMLEPQMYLPPIRTTLKPSASPKPSPSRPSGIRKVYSPFCDFISTFFPHGPGAAIRPPCTRAGAGH
jgi:hypothetical protein